LKPENQKIRDAYVKRIADSLVLAGSMPDEANANAAKILAIETRIAGKKLTPVEKRDPAKRFVTMRYDEVKAMLGNVDLDAYFAAMGLPTGGNITLQDSAAMRERNALLAELPPADIKAYLRWELLRRMSAYLTPAFIGPNKAFTEALYGKVDIPPRNRLVAVEAENALGHPLGSRPATASSRSRRRMRWDIRWDSSTSRRTSRPTRAVPRKSWCSWSKPSSVDESQRIRGCHRQRAARRLPRSTR